MQPPFDLYATPHEFVFVIHVPGNPTETFDIGMFEEGIQISGVIEYGLRDGSGKMKHLVKTGRSGTFEAEFLIPSGSGRIDVESTRPTDSRYRHGLLTVRVPRRSG